MAQIPNWIIRIEEKGRREQALTIWADLQRARERAQLEYAQSETAASDLYESTRNDAAVKRDRAIHKAKDVYEKAKQDIIKPVSLVADTASG